ncbi:hypothetical protein [Streptomyces phaeoluteigriseus]
MLHVNPKMLAWLSELEADLLQRRTQAEAEGWIGEIKGIDLTQAEGGEGLVRPHAGEPEARRTRERVHHPSAMVQVSEHPLEMEQPGTDRVLYPHGHPRVNVLGRAADAVDRFTRRAIK